MSESKVSVILTSYNRPEYLVNAIESVIDQTHQNWELLVMDDNSPADVINPIKEFYNDRRIFFFNSEVKDAERLDKCRYAININEGLRSATGEYISYLTDDDDYLPHRLQVMADLLDSRSDINVVYGQQYCYYENSNNIAIPWVRETRGILQSAACLVDHNSIMHRKYLIDEVGMWEESAVHWGSGDAVFWNKLTEAGHYFYPIDDILDRHRFHDQSVQSRMIRGENII